MTDPWEELQELWKQKIHNKSAIIGIVGLGYVGLPLAVSFAEAGFHVLGFDIQQEKIEALNKGQSYIIDVSSIRLKAVIDSLFLQATTNQHRLSEPDVICICVPTPITRTKDPDLSFVTYESEEIARHIRQGQLIVLESTTYPGTTRQVILPILESSKLKGGKDFFLAYSPERVDPGSKEYNIRNTPKIVGGIDSQSTDLAQILYSQVAETVVSASCPEVAEMTKIFENVFRSVNIALVNELTQLCHSMNVSVWEVIDAASTKPFGYMPFYPGPGIGGHCIPLDPYYLAHKAREFDFHTRFIELAAEINENMPYYVTYQILNLLNSKGKCLTSSNILILGVAYKKDTSDLRESPSLKLIQLLEEKGANISYNDPFIPEIELHQNILKSVLLTEEILSSADCVIIATDHSNYNPEQIVACSNLIFDARGITRGINSNNIIRLGE